jgi:hypothetical protein
VVGRLPTEGKGASAQVLAPYALGVELVARWLAPGLRKALKRIEAKDQRLLLARDRGASRLSQLAHKICSGIIDLARGAASPNTKFEPNRTRRRHELLSLTAGGHLVECQLERADCAGAMPTAELVDGHRATTHGGGGIECT